MDIVSLEIADVKLIRLRRHIDHRGFFSEVYNKAAFAAAGIDLEFVQDNHSMSAQVGTVRGLHFQRPPFAQDKLVRVSKGAIFDVAVDLRVGSPSYGKYVATEISSENWAQILVPVGFAHGFCTLTPDTEVLYKVSSPYNAPCDDGIIWDDPEIAIAWPAAADKSLLSAKDLKLGSLRHMTSPFTYDSGVPGTNEGLGR